MPPPKLPVKPMVWKPLKPRKPKRFIPDAEFITYGQSEQSSLALFGPVALVVLCVLILTILYAESVLR